MNYPRYPKYKDSGVEWLEEVPEGWEVKRLSAFFTERREKVNDIDYPALSVGKFGVAPQIETAAKTDAGDNRKLVCINDFVINSRSDRKGASGVSSFDGSVSLIYIVLEVKQDTYSNFIHNLFRSIPFQEEFYRYGKGIVADLWSTNYSEMKNIMLAMPSMDEQQTIAAFLDHNCAKIDALVAEQEKLITLLHEKRQAVISHAVTKGLNPDAPMKDSGVEWLGDVPEGWEIGKVAFGYEVVLGKMLQPTPKGANDQLTPYYRALNIQWEAIVDELLEMWVAPEEIKKFAVQKGDLLVCEGGEVGRAAILDFQPTEPMIIQNALHRVRARQNFNVSFLLRLLQHAVSSNFIITICNKSTIAHFTGEKLKNLGCPLPPLSEQQTIVTYLDTETAKIDALIAESEKAVALLKERRSALISAAVTGKIDVRTIPLQEAV